jgi:soluble lytic murein transglycosylase-like protein
MWRGRFVGAAVVFLCLLEIGRAAGIPVLGFLTPGVNAAVTAAGEETADVRNRIDLALRRSNSRLDSSMRDRIASAVLRCERDQGLAPDLVLAVLLVESSGRPDARSPKGAIGLMQVMPHMFEELGLPGNVAHVESNVEAGCLLLADNVRRLGEERGISAYFWGGSIQGDGYLRRVRSVLDKLARAPRSATSPSDG